MYEWDATKRQCNVRRHSIDFLDILRKGPGYPHHLRPQPTNGSSETMSGAHITKATTTDGRSLSEQPDGTYRQAESQTDWAWLDAMTDEEVERLASTDDS